MEIDLLSVGRYAGAQPHDQFDWLRSHDPVHRHDEPDGPGFWALTRYDDVRTVGRDSGRFSSTPTIMLTDPEEGDGVSVDGGHQMMLMADPPVHTRMRRLVSADFTPRAAARLQPRIAELATQIVDEVVERGECDLVTDLAGEMPSFVIAELLGIPLEDGRRLYHFTEAVHSSEEVVSHEERANAYGQMFAYSQEVYADKRANPADDLATLLATGAIEDRPIDEVDFFLWFLLLVDAGGDTTRNLVGAGMEALFRHPDQLALLRTDVDGLLPTAVEELLRWVSPVIYMRRTATADTEIGGQPIPAGDKVVMYYGAANRDPDVFDQPHQLDIGRTPNQHVAFGGGGPHFCMGSHLARIEISMLLREILTRLDDLESTGEPTWMGSNFIFGPTHLPVSFKPGARTGRPVVTA
ncbi:MAG: cytochrome P450 [Acidimicrobiales bacterium]